MKEILISYTGRSPVEIDFAQAERNEQKLARREKREPKPFLKLAAEKSRVLTLRPNTTATVSESELEAIKAVVGDLAFKRCVHVHVRPARPTKPVAKVVKAPPLPKPKKADEKKPVK